jgi:NAD(P)H-dependent flavin oxidoreductase YrpB (nitropropane dioxygenase family)
VRFYTSLKNIPTLRIGNLETRVPIIQGGMGVGISLSGLASAVANEGGIGVIATAGIGQLEPDSHTNFNEANNRALRKELARTRAKTNGIIGLNIMVALSDFDDLVQCGVDEKVDVLFLGAGLPIRLPKTLPLDALGSLHTKFVPIVSSDRAAELIFKSWAKHFNHVPDAVVVEGPLAGGHLGFRKEDITDPEHALEKLVPSVISAIKPYEQKFQKSIPVIAGGGIYTGEDIYKFMQLGASAVQMATRFVATFECDASDEFKQAFLRCTKDDIIIIDSPVGLPGRAIRCEFLDRIASGQKEPFKCPWKCLRSCDFKNVPYCIAVALTNAKNGDLKDGFAFAGANVYRVNKLVSVKDLIDGLMEEYSNCAARAPAGIRAR